MTIVKDEATGETILEIEVRGKRGVGYCKEHARRGQAVRTSERVAVVLCGSTNRDVEEPMGQKTRLPEPTDLLFPKWQRELFNTILDEEKLKADRDGQARTAYSLRHTYICLRLMEGADIYQIAKNCRTSVEMIEKFYASHIKTRLDAAAINIMRKKKVAKVVAKELRTGT